MRAIKYRLEKVHQLIKAISANRDCLIDTAVKDAGFTIRECRIEVDMNLDNLRGFDEMVTLFSERQPICSPDQEIALLLPYNGSAWLNTAIISIFLVGNRVKVKFATRGSEISRFLESLYKPMFGTVGVNQGRSESWKGAFVSKPVGGYGYFGWIWETVNENFIIKQGPKLLSIETSQKP